MQAMNDKLAKTSSGSSVTSYAVQAQLARAKSSEKTGKVIAQPVILNREEYNTYSQPT
jgi:hypothetical protein